MASACSANTMKTSGTKMNLGASLLEATIPRRSIENISDKRYQKWLAQATWDRMSKMTVGQSFCKFFNVHDYFLLYTTNQEQQWKHIQRCYRPKSAVSWQNLV